MRSRSASRENPKQRRNGAQYSFGATLLEPESAFDMSELRQQGWNP
jgi:hypothetical protein